MSLPISTRKPSGSGRLLEICSFRKSDVTEERFASVMAGLMNTSSRFPIARGSYLGKRQDDSNIVVLVADWTSAAEKDLFEPTEPYQSLKPAFGEILHPTDPGFACHHIILPNSEVTAPYELFSFSFIKATTLQQDGLTAALQRYAESRKSGMLEAAAAREDGEILVVVEAWNDKAEIDAIEESDPFNEFQAQIAKVGAKMVDRYRASLKKFAGNL